MDGAPGTRRGVDWPEIGLAGDWVLEVWGGLPDLKRRVYDSLAVVLGALHLPAVTHLERFPCETSRWELEMVLGRAARGADHLVEE